MREAISKKNKEPEYENILSAIQKLNKILLAIQSQQSKAKDAFEYKYPEIEEIYVKLSEDQDQLFLIAIAIVVSLQTVGIALMSASFRDDPPPGRTEWSLM